eukprot:scaffold6286_cov48-Cyclotella_meneghiniana.AAC.8
MKRGIIIFATMLFHTVISMPSLPGIQEKQLEDTTSLLEGFPDLNPFKNICLGFVGQDIGHPGIEGCSESTGPTLISVRWEYFFGGPYEIEGSGKGISGTYDEFHYFMQPIPVWNHDIEAHVVNNFNKAGYQGGIMVREDTRSDSKYFALLIDGDGVVWQKVRHHNGGDTESRKVSSGVSMESDVFFERGRRPHSRPHKPPSKPTSKPTSSGVSMDSDVFLKVSVKTKWRIKCRGWSCRTCRDFEFRSYYRRRTSDGWTEVGSQRRLEFPLIDDTFSGIAVTSQNNAELAKLD